MMMILGGVLGRLLFCAFCDRVEAEGNLEFSLTARKMLASLWRRQLLLCGELVVEVDEVCRGMVSSKIEKRNSIHVEYLNGVKDGVI